MIWYTVGPASLGKEQELIDAGATGIRLGFSFDGYQAHEATAIRYKTLSDRAGVGSLVIADLPGEKYRIGRFDAAPSVEVVAGTALRLVHARSTDVGQSASLAVPNADFFKHIQAGSTIVVGDGGAVLEVRRVDHSALVADVALAESGKIDQLRGLTVQGGNFVPKSLCGRDLEAIEFVTRSGCFDAVALSFVSSAADVTRVRELLRERSSDIEVIAKIETMQGVVAVAEIAEAADIIMAARGDLALSVPWTDLALYVAQIAKASRNTGVPWVLATQLVEGLERFSMPTRAEICDLWQWLDADCSGLLLSYETAFGPKPEASVAAVRQIAQRWELLHGRME